MTEEVRTDNKETLKNALKRIAELEAQIEKMKCDAVKEAFRQGKVI